MSTDKGTPTSVIFTQEPDLGQLHMPHECHSVHHPVAHELIPIVTMAPNGPSPGMPAEMMSELGPGAVVGQSMLHPIGDPSHGAGLPMMTSNLNTGVYTLPEESEQESEECPAM
ncbi:hypothetical protein ZHAS_00008031 [Anopheles sinensis]|uniref:Uncharacterized protein n=1 Tax=Anopheles sinensis TaxID=74873 RepID=A0A084VRE2_ANOSI|nr:hypothetical protein ZHAS_00008031 [Anopheles sinensis]